jgi:hypothetical protein
MSGYHSRLWVGACGQLILAKGGLERVEMENFHGLFPEAVC